MASHDEPVNVANRTNEVAQDRLWFLESMDQLSRAMQDTEDLEQLSHVLEAVLLIFGCDRAWLAYPSDTDSRRWRTVAERACPEFAGTPALDLDLPMDPEIAEVFRLVEASEVTVRFGAGGNPLSSVLAKRFGARSQMCLAVHPKIGRPYTLGLDQCASPHIWTRQEQELFEAAGKRLATLLTSLLLSRDLQESKARLEEAQRIAHVGYWDWNIETNVVVWSDETYRIFGVERGERPMDFETVRALVHPEDRDALYSTVDVELDAGVHPVADFRIVTPSGEVRTVHAITSKLWSALPGDPGKGKSGKTHRLFGTVQDITELKRAEDARHALSRDLQESRAWLEEAQRVAHLGYWVWDLDSNRVIWSEETCRIFGLAPQVTSMDIAAVVETFHPDDREAVFRTAEEAIRSGTRAECEHRLIRPDGEVRVVHSLGDVRNNSEGRAQLFGTTQDITDRKRVEEERQTLSSALQQSNARLEEAQRVAHIGYYEWKPLENSVTWSDELYRIYGLPPGEGPIDMAIVFEMVHPEDRENVRREADEAIRSGTPLRTEHRIVRPNGEVRFVQALGTVKRDASGRVYEMFGTGQDITDQKRVEEDRQALSIALQQSNARLEEAQRVTHVGHFEWNLIDSRVNWSKELYCIYGLPPQEGPIDLATIFEMIHPEDREYVAREAQETIRSGIHSKAEHRIVRPDGEVRFVQVHGTVKRDALGRAYEMFGTSQDITERKLAEQALRRNQFYLSEGERLAHMGSWASKDLGISWSDDLDIYWSDEVYKIFGFDPKHGTPTLQQFLAAIHPQDRASLAEAIKTMHKQHCNCDVTSRVVRPDGEIRYVRCVGIPVVEAGVFQGYHGTTMDVTEQELLTQELRREQAYLIDAQSMAHIGSWAYNLIAHKLLHSSDENARLYGFDPSQGPISAERFFDTQHTEDEPWVNAALEKAVREGTDFYLPEYRIWHTDGSIRFLRAIGHRNASGEPGEYVGVTMDITERKRAEEERERLRQLEAKLAHITRVNMMGELAAALAHEIKQPIAASVTSANALLRWLAHDPPDLERARAAATRVDREGNRAADIINSLRAFYRTGTPGERQMVDVKGTIDEMRVLLQTEAARYSVTIHTELESAIPNVLADRVQLQQILMNLMLNGIEAMKGCGGALTISSEVNSEGQLTVSICDTGVGLPAESAEVIFNPFHTTKPQGTGMGLTITRSIVEAYGGRVWATANRGAGTTFHFTLPGGAEAHA
jgi:PAS domain S-box-containing protein